jgi:hypothetical protein
LPHLYAAKLRGGQRRSRSQKDALGVLSEAAAEEEITPDYKTISAGRQSRAPRNGFLDY